MSRKQNKDGQFSSSKDDADALIPGDDILGDDGVEAPASIPPVAPVAELTPPTPPAPGSAELVVFDAKPALGADSTLIIPKRSLARVRIGKKVYGFHKGRKVFVPREILPHLKHIGVV